MPPGAVEDAHGVVEGIVVERSSSTAWVDTGREVLACSLRGKLRSAEPCVAGDRVHARPAGNGTGVVESILPRRSVLRRGGLTGEPEGRVTAANVDAVAIVISAASPPPRWGLVDRLLIEADLEGLSRVVIVNKVDLLPAGPEPSRALAQAIEEYRAAGVSVGKVSALSGRGLAELRDALSARVTVLSGHSGVGKTTILNALVPGLDLPTKGVNPVTGKGRHTTSAAVLVKLPGGGYAMDTPGFREFALQGIAPADLGRWYPEFREAIALCRFKDCLHRDEPSCGVRRAVDAGDLSKLRYQNYLQILWTLVDKDSQKSQKRFARRGSGGSS